ncbi:MAG: hypothetical protein WBK47_00250 [Acetomicrobium sp.]|jgi:hypothetical protein
MKFEERSYVDRCLDVVMGRCEDDATIFIRVPSYSDLPKDARQRHKREVLDFLKSTFPEMQEVYGFRDTFMFKVSIPTAELCERLDFPKESEDDNSFRKEAEIAFKKLICAKSAAIYSEDSALWETANLVSAKVFPKFPYPLRADLSVEDKDVVVVSFPWLAYRFYAPLFENVASLLLKSFKGKVMEEPLPAQASSSVWTKRIKVEGDEKTRLYVANLVKQGLESVGNFSIRFDAKEAKLKDSHISKFARIVTDFKDERKKKEHVKRTIKDRIVPYNDSRLIYVQLLPKTYEKKKDEIKKFAEEKGLKGGEFVPNTRLGYYKSYIVGSSKSMKGLEERIRFARELSERTGIDLEISKPAVEIYETKDASGNTRVCVRIPNPWDRSLKDRENAHEYSKALNNLIKEFQLNDWDPVFPGIYVSTYSVLIPKGSDESEIEEAKKEAVEIISKFEEIEYSFVDMREKRAAEAERQIRKNIVDIER